MNGILLELPAALREKVQEQAARQSLSEAAFIEEALEQKLAAIDQLRYLEERAQKGNRQRFRELRAKVPAVEPAPEDRR